MKVSFEDAMELNAFNLAPDAATIAQSWMQSLAKEKRVATKTLEAYGRDLLQFGGFLTLHLGEPATVKALTDLPLADFRSFMVPCGRPSWPTPFRGPCRLRWRKR
jgi:Phage integrase, N-terminal SAM-like domain